MHDVAQIRNVGLQAGYFIFIQHAAHPFDSKLACGSPYNQLANHRIIINRNFIAIVYITVDTYTDTVRFSQLTDNTRRRHEIIFGIFGTDTALYGMSALLQVFLLIMKRFTVSNTNLVLHQVHPYYFFCNRVFHLEACIHFEEIKVTMFVYEEFDGAGTFVMNGFCRGYSRFSHLLAKLGSNKRRGGFFHYFLITALDRTFTLEKMDSVSVIIT